MKGKVLVVEDDAAVLDSTRRILEYAGYEVLAAGDGKRALEIAVDIRQKALAPIDVVLSDMRMPKLGGMELLRALRKGGVEVPFIIMTAFGKVEDAVWAMRLGAVDFILKPIRRQAILDSVAGCMKRAAAAMNGNHAAAVPASQAARVPHGIASERRLVGSGPAMRLLLDAIDRVAPTSANVLITGESGTGKELVACAIHERSGRQGRLVALNCAAIPENLLESELFGYEKGAFSGANQPKEGLFEAAVGGTLLLDEIGDMPLALQSKILRVLQEREVRRLGGTRSIPVDVRVLASTHRDLHEAQKSGEFRQDLIYRLEVISMHVAALRERRDDIAELVDHFVDLHGSRHHKRGLLVDSDALAALHAHGWPGNVRELSNVIERAVIFCSSGAIRVVDLPAHLSPEGVSEPVASDSSRGGGIFVKVGTPLRDVEDLLIRKTLEANDGDKERAARQLGIHSRTIYRKLDPKGSPKSG